MKTSWAVKLLYVILIVLFLLAGFAVWKKEEFGTV